jgi:pre-mRNA-splicing factor SYF2
MAEDVNKQKEKREKYSRRRRHDPDADIDYINERNMKFNQKLERSALAVSFFPLYFFLQLGA